MEEFSNAARDIYANCRLVKWKTAGDLRELAKKDEVTNNRGLAVYHTKITSRSAGQTVDNVNLSKESDSILSEITKVKNYLKGKELVCVEGYIGATSKALKARSLVTKEFARLNFMNHGNFFPAEDNKEPDITIITVPEWEKLAVYVDPDEGVTFILGSDYYGELKMAILRHAMHHAREKQDGLGLHAGSKLYRFKDGERGALIFGLSGTGKTTITVADHGLEEPEGIEILQDDINLLDRETKAHGTEKNFYVKTDNVTEQPGLLEACLAKDAIIENVAIKNGEIDFDDVEFCSNGRCVVNREKIPSTSKSIDLRKTDVIFFNTRRYDIPIAGRLVSPEQAATYFMLGESTKTSAGTMDKSQVGKPVRVVGFDPFIVDRHYKSGQRFYEILKENPHVRVYVLNTGKVGGMEKGVKIRPEDTLKIVEEIARRNVEWRFDETIGYDVPAKVEGLDLDRFDPYKIYDKGHFEKLMAELRADRKEYLKRFPELDFLEI